MEPFPRTGAKYQISRGHSHAPVWSPDGRELFYYDVGAGRLVAVSIQTQPSFSFGNPNPVPVQIVDAALLAVIVRRQYDVTSDGQRFLVLMPAPSTTNGPPSQRRIDIVLSWFEELTRLVPTN